MIYPVWIQGEHSITVFFSQIGMLCWYTDEAGYSEVGMPIHRWSKQLQQIQLDEWRTPRPRTQPSKVLGEGVAKTNSSRAATDGKPAITWLEPSPTDKTAGKIHGEARSRGSPSSCCFLRGTTWRSCSHECAHISNCWREQSNYFDQISLKPIG